MAKRYYIAYGSNLNIRQMQMRCPQSRIIGTSEIADYELLFKGSQTGSYLTIEQKAGGSVPVVAWEVTETDELALDRYEGFPHFYYKAEMKLPIKGIKTGKIRVRDAFVYIMHEDRPIGMPSDFYMRTCLEGYRAFGFDGEILYEALENSRGVCEVKGSKRDKKRSWYRGRGPYSLRGEIKYSLKRNKKHLNRKARRRTELPSRCAYKKLAKNKAWEYMT